MMFSANLRVLRKKYNYSQEYLADKLNVTRQTISKWENATAMPDLKKLTEISEFFGVTMDYLLGTENNSGISDVVDTDFDVRYKEAYNKQLVAMIKENQEKQAKMNHTLKVLIAFVAVALMIVSIVFSSVTSNLSSQVATLQNYVNGISSNTTSADDEDSVSDYTEYELISTDKDNPNIATMKFEYAPDTYSKHAKVYLEVVDKNGKSKKTDAQLKLGSFIITVALDVTQVEDIYLFVDDGQNVSKEDMDINFVDLYFCINTANPTYIENPYASDSYEYTFDPVYWNKADTMKPIRNVYMIAKSNNKTLFEKELKIQAGKDSPEYDETYDYFVNAELIRTKQRADRFVLKFVDSDYNEYYINIYDMEEMPDSCNPTILFKNSKKLTYEE